MLTDSKDEVSGAQETHYFLPVGLLDNNNSTEDFTHSSSTQETTVEHNPIQYYITNALERYNGTVSPLASG